MPQLPGKELLDRRLSGPQEVMKRKISELAKNQTLVTEPTFLSV
jgi:hypothetical protein